MENTFFFSFFKNIDSCEKGVFGSFFFNTGDMKQYRSRLYQLFSQLKKSFLTENRGKKTSPTNDDLALNKQFIAQRRLSQQYECYQSVNLEKIFNLTTIVAHSFKEGAFLSEHETLNFLTNIKETSRSLQEKKFKPLEKVEVSVIKLFQHIKDILHWTLEHNNTSLNFHYDPASAPFFKTDPFLLEVLLLGFLKSIRFSLYRGSKIMVTLKEDSSDQLNLSIKISGYLIREWSPFQDALLDYGCFTLSGNQLDHLSQALNACVTKLSQKEFLIQVKELDIQPKMTSDKIIRLVQ